MKNRLVQWLWPLALLSGCEMIKVTQDTTIELPAALQQAELVRFANPSALFSNESLSIGGLEIKSREVGSWELKREKINEEFEHSGLMGFVLFGDALSYVKEEFLVTAARDFSFELMAQGGLKGQSKCAIFALSNKTETTRHEVHNGIRSSLNDFGRREKTELLCTIQQGGTLWQLRLSAAEDEAVQVELTSQGKRYTVQLLNRAYSILPGQAGPEHRELPSWASMNAGLLFSNADKQALAAYSFVGDQKLWLSQIMSDTQRELLLSVAYSLAMFHWYGGDWQPMPQRLMMR
ncbi:hypothetical protein [Pseudoalteromonas rubra]|uniref:Lipoprotein n=1 Tax=Pseudoalteromonas rubra TaxID=43658 RepID=A0A5S3WWE6_9GAMM|nr:hypothetical protein [Pseudoalteromonas rubra]TMP35053.1 hypothetical protein CWB98_16660 [Pseudoalteromonas rubra]